MPCDLSSIKRYSWPKFKFFLWMQFSMEVIQHGAQITELFWIHNNVLSSMYTWSKNKFPCDLFPKWLYALVKKLKIAKKLHWKKYLLMPKRTHKKIDNFRKPLISHNKFVLNYVNCRASRVILSFLLWVT